MMRWAPQRWDLDIAAARELQRSLADRVETRDRLPTLQTVAGVDVGFEDEGRTAKAAVAVLSFPGLELVAQAIARVPVDFPYVPGYLSFRELPAVIAALERLETLPDLVLCDGQGRAHPRRLGVASHLGVATDLPTIGVAKTRLVGDFVEPGSGKGSTSPLTIDGEVVGTVLRTRDRVKPLFVSVGHRVSLDTAADVTLRCCPRFRLPETTRWAHRLASGD